MALSASSCRFTQGVGHLRNKHSTFLQETAISTRSSQQQVNEGPQASSYLSQSSTASGTGSGSIPGITASPEVPLSFPSHMRSRNTQNNLVMTQLNNRSTAGNKVSSVKDRKKSNQKSKSTYKHVPHREKPAHLVARRNARERRRVQAVNSAFLRLRRHVPHENKHKRLSKVKTLHIAIDYIHYLKGLIEEYDARVQEQQQQQHPQQQQQQPHPQHMNEVCGQTINYTHAQMVDLSDRYKENQHWMQNNMGGVYLWSRTHPSGRHPPVQCMLGYGQQAGGTQPTGMHSCS